MINHRRSNTDTVSLGLCVTLTGFELRTNILKNVPTSDNEQSISQSKWSLLVQFVAFNGRLYGFHIKSCGVWKKIQEVAEIYYVKCRHSRLP